MVSLVCSLRADWKNFPQKLDEVKDFMVFQIKNNQLTKNIVSGAAAIGVLAGVGIAAAPAQASQLEFDDGTDDFFAEVNPIDDNAFDVVFSPDGLATSFSATGQFEEFFPVTPALYSLTPATGNFTYTGVGDGTIGSPMEYTLDNNLVFAFTNGVSLTLEAGSEFAGEFDFDNGTPIGVGFEIDFDEGSFFTIPGEGIVPTTSFEMTFGDIAESGGGEYGVVASKEVVPEPASILGLLAVGGLGLGLKRKKQA
jgi:hypothetical protein